MKYTEKEILEIAKKILKDLQGKYYNEKCIDSVHYNKKNDIDISLKIPTWTIFINSLFDNLDILIISDQTGEPLYIQNFNTIISEIEKDKNGNYRYKK